MKKRVLIISRNFPPLVGGMERLIFNVYQQVQADYICDIVGPCGCKEYVKKGVCARECPTGSILLFLCFAVFQGLVQSFFHRPDYIIAGSGVTAPIATFLGKMWKVPSVVFIHGLDLLAENLVYQRIFVPAILKADMIIANSHNTAKLAEGCGVDKKRITVLFPGVEVFEESAKAVQFREKYGLEHRKIILFVGRLIPRKGLKEFIQLSLPNIIEEVEESVLLVIGTEPKNALKREVGVVQIIADIIERQGLQEKILLLGEVDEEILLAAYSEADVLVFPLLEIKNDVEGFGMVAVEAAAMGLPTVAFDVGGVKDAVEDGTSGFLLKPEDYDMMTTTIVRFLTGDEADIDIASCRSHAKKFTWPIFGQKLRDVLKNLRHN